jgi:hypothetical protein
MVGANDATAIERLLKQSFPGYERMSDPGDPIVVFERRDPTDVRVVVDLIRSTFISKYGYRPRLSPRHVLATGQPNVVGNVPAPPVVANATGPPKRTTKRFEPRSGRVGEGIVVALVDTGISYHPWIDGGYVAAPGDVWSADQYNVFDTATGGMRLGDQAGHALFLTGLVLRQAPAAVVKVFQTADADGLSNIYDVTRAIRAAGASGADIINLSLGCYTANDMPPWTLQDGLAELPAPTAVVASAGNLWPGEDNSGRPFWPAAFPRVTAVGAWQESGGGWVEAPFSNTGSWVNAHAPGDDVVSTYFDERTSAGWATWSGTSMAAATWSGLLARVASEYGVDGTRADRIVRAHSDWKFQPAFDFTEDVPADAVTTVPTDGGNGRTARAPRRARAAAR